jgi:hypothetical protein
MGTPVCFNAGTGGVNAAHVFILQTTPENASSPPGLGISIVQEQLATCRFTAPAMSGTLREWLRRQADGVYWLKVT